MKYFLFFLFMVLAMPVWASDKPPEPKVRINCDGLPMDECFQKIEEVKWKLIKAHEWNKTPDGVGCASKDIAEQFHMEACR